MEQSEQMTIDDYINESNIYVDGELVSSYKRDRSIKFKLLHDSAILPVKTHPTDSGFDLYASENVVIEPGETKVIPTGVAIGLPKGTEAQVRPRSGITSKTKLRVQLGTIDNGYTGEIGVIVDNINPVEEYEEWKLTAARYLNGGYDAINRFGDVMSGSYVVRKGDKIAQLVVQYLPKFEAVEVEGLVGSPRGGNGFGSSGVREDE